MRENTSGRNTHSAGIYALHRFSCKNAAGREVEMTYQTCPLDKIMDNDNKWYAEKLFHQFRCTKCGTIYGMLCNTHTGGQIKINDKVFNPADYPDKKEDK